jgi:hypothetical protein
MRFMNQPLTDEVGAELGAARNRSFFGGLAWRGRGRIPRGGRAIVLRRPRLAMPGQNSSKRAIVRSSPTPPAGGIAPAAALPLLALASCFAGGNAARDGEPAQEPAASAFVVRDSAGVIIAESRDSSWTSGLAWRIEAEPALEIGSVSGAAAGTDFARIGSVARLADGTIAVADELSVEVRLFGADGAFLRTLGRRGRGPGEMTRVSTLAVIAGDTLVVRDDANLRHVIFSPAGEHIRTVQAPPAPWLSEGGRAGGWFPDGGFLFGPVGVDPAIRSGLELGRHLLDGAWHRFDSAGAHVGPVARLPARHVEVGAVRGTSRSVALPLAYGPTGQYAPSGRGIWHGFPQEYELVHIAAEGIDRIVRRAWSPEALPPALESRYREWYASRPPRTEVPDAIREEYIRRARTEIELESRGLELPAISFTAFLPAFVGVMAARDGTLWVQETATARELLAASPVAIGSDRWSVFDDDGRWLGTVVAPSGLRIHEIGADYVLGVATAEHGVELVRLHRIVRPSP